MFSPRHIRDEVVSRLKLMMFTDEDTIHTHYSALMYQELDGARQRIGKLRLLLEQSKASHPGKGWIMVSQEQRQELLDLVRELEREMSP